jgi:dihydrofolate reductase
MDVVLDISVSLDGYVAAPNDRPGEELGDGGRRLHEWARAPRCELDREALHDTWARAGAAISGARTFDVCFERWGGRPPRDCPWFVLSHDCAERVARGGSAFRFAEGVESALARARAAADGGHVVVVGGARAARSFLNAGLVDVLALHVAPVVLGGGVRLFEGVEPLALETERVVETPAATHLRYRVR